VIDAVLIDDHAAVRAGLLTLLRREPGMVPVAVADCVDDGMAAIARKRPDVALVDYQLPDGDGLALCRRVKALSDPPRVLIYSAYASHELRMPALLSRADGLIDKSAPPEQLFEAIRRATRGERLMARPSPDEMAEAAGMLAAEDLPIVGMLLDGTPPHEVAQVLRIGSADLDERIEAMSRRFEPKLDREPVGGDRSL
jgi:two-component system, NarL family, response regulator DevR